MTGGLGWNASAEDRTHATTDVAVRLKGFIASNIVQCVVRRDEDEEGMSVGAL